ncbi:hypothetical protein V2J09_007416 [Rumex salicifolius]
MFRAILFNFCQKKRGKIRFSSCAPSALMFLHSTPSPPLTLLPRFRRVPIQTFSPSCRNLCFLKGLLGFDVFNVYVSNPINFSNQATPILMTGFSLGVILKC